MTIKNRYQRQLESPVLKQAPISTWNVSGSWKNNTLWYLCSHLKDGLFSKPCHYLGEKALCPANHKRHKIHTEIPQCLSTPICAWCLLSYSAFSRHVMSVHSLVACHLLNSTVQVKCWWDYSEGFTLDRKSRSENANSALLAIVMAGCTLKDITNPAFMLLRW